MGRFANIGRLVAGAVIGLVGLLWMLANTIGSLVGVVTVKEELTTIKGAAAALIGWLVHSPPVAAYGFGLVLVGLGVVVLFWHPGHGWRGASTKSHALPQQQEASPLVSAPRPSASVPRLQRFEGPYEGAHLKLLLFVVGHMIPTVDSMFNYEAVVAGILPGSPLVKELTVGGVRYRQRESNLFEDRFALRNLMVTPPANMEQDEMERRVTSVRKCYSAYCVKLLKFEKLVEAETGVDPRIFSDWQDWRDLHDRMVEAYDAIRLDGALKFLFSPAHPVSWGPDKPLTGLLDNPN